MIGFHVKPGTVLETHFTLSFEYHQQFFMLSGAVLSDRFVGRQNYQPRLHRDAFRRPSEHLQIVFSSAVELDHFGPRFLLGLRRDQENGPGKKHDNRPEENRLHGGFPHSKFRKRHDLPLFVHPLMYIQ
jgi:hypothetical protein